MTQTLILLFDMFASPLILLTSLAYAEEWSPPPLYGSTAHLKVVTIPPYYENVTEVVFDASESEPGFDGTNLVPIDWYYFDFGDGSPLVNTTTPSAPTYTSMLEPTQSH
jgi:hypothetical protein